MVTIDIGRMNKRLTILTLKDVKDEMGQSVKKLSEVATVWGSLYPIRGAEFYEVQKVQGRTTHKAYIRYRKGIDQGSFIKCEGITYSVESAIDVKGEHKLIEIMCTEHTGKEVIGDV